MTSSDQEWHNRGHSTKDYTDQDIRDLTSHANDLLSELRETMKEINVRLQVIVEPIATELKVLTDEEGEGGSE